MEISILSVVVLVLVIWYFGRSINSIVKHSGEMADDEFKVFRREQQLRLHKTRVAQTKAVKDIAKDEVLSDEDFDKIFRVDTDAK